MTNGSVAVVLVGAMLAVATSAHAQDDATQAGFRATPEIAPYAFLGSNGSSGVGAAVRWPLPNHLSVEVETSSRLSDVARLNANFSLLFDLPEIGRVTPYVAAGVGLDQYAYAETAPSGAMVAESGTALSVNAGGGVRVGGDQTWGMRTDARWSNGIGRKAPERWRLYNGVTFNPKGR
jgi:hypothetical protein